MSYKQDSSESEKIISDNSDCHGFCAPSQWHKDSDVTNDKTIQAKRAVSFLRQLLFYTTTIRGYPGLLRNLKAHFLIAILADLDFHFVYKIGIIGFMGLSGERFSTFLASQCACAEHCRQGYHKQQQTNQSLHNLPPIFP